MSIRVAINGFGRIGRNVLRAIAESGRKDIEVVGINDLGPVETNAHLLRYDSVHGRFPGEVTVKGDTMSVGGNAMKVTAERDPAKTVNGDSDGHGQVSLMDARLMDARRLAAAALVRGVFRPGGPGVNPRAWLSFQPATRLSLSGRQTVEIRRSNRRLLRQFRGSVNL